MANKIGIFSLWLMFSVWGYILIISLLGFFWFQRHKSVHQLYSKRLLLLNILLALINGAGQIAAVLLFVWWGDQIIQGNLPESAIPKSVWTGYLVLFLFNLFLMFAQLITFLFLSNNLAVKFTAEKLHIIGMSVLYSAIIGLEKQSDGTVVLKYVYKKENRRIWTEQLKFIKHFETTDFLWRHASQFFDPERNLAFFDLDQVAKKSTAVPPAIASPSSVKKKKTPVSKE